MKVFHSKSGKSQLAIDALVEKFKTGDISVLANGIKFQVPKEFPSSKYSIRNKMMAYAQVDSIVTGSFNFWKGKGRMVRKGSKAAYIFAPLQKAYDDDDGDTQYFTYGFKPIPTHPIENTDPIPDFEGDIIQAPDLEPADLPPLTDIAEMLGLKIDWKPVPMDRWADYWKKGERINMGTDSPKVFFHELGHALHEEVDGKFTERSKQYKEVVAEFSSAVMMNVYLGEDTSGNAWEYIKHFAENPTEAVEKSLRMIQKMFYQLDKLQEVTSD